MRKMFSLFVLAAAVFGGCATTEGWNKVQSKNFNLYTDTEEHYKETLRQLENAYAGLSSTFFRDKDVGKVDVLFLDDSEFVDYFGNFRRGAALSKVPGESPIGKAGLLVLRPHVFDPSLGKAGEMESNSPTAGEGAMGNRGALAAKEMLTHVFIDRVMPQAPLWFHEGFAAYVRTSELRGDGQKTFACFGYQQKTEGLLPVSSLWNIGFHEYATPERRGFFPSTGYTMIDYIMHADDNKNRGMMGPMVNALASGAPSAESVKAAFGGADDATIDNLLGNHKQLIEQQIDSNAQVRGLCPFGVVVPPSLVPEEAAPKIEPVPPETMAALFHALKALPARDEYPPYYPPAIVDKVTVPPLKP